MKKGPFIRTRFYLDPLDEAFGITRYSYIHPYFQKIKELETIEIEDALKSNGWNVVHG